MNPSHLDFCHAVFPSTKPHFLPEPGTLALPAHESFLFDHPACGQGDYDSENLLANLAACINDLIKTIYRRQVQRNHMIYIYMYIYIMYTSWYYTHGFSGPTCCFVAVLNDLHLKTSGRALLPHQVFTSLALVNSNLRKTFWHRSQHAFPLS